eukprot:2909967-Lingulodinium_polyedra.AAC.1
MASLRLGFSKVMGCWPPARAQGAMGLQGATLLGQVMKDLKGFIPHQLDEDELEGLSPEEEQ